MSLTKIMQSNANENLNDWRNRDEHEKFDCYEIPTKTTIICSFFLYFIYYLSKIDIELY
jgi:hypothetical protein